MTVTATARRITRELLIGIPGQHRGVVSATEPGLMAGADLLDASAAPDPAGEWIVLRTDGEHVEPGEPLVEVRGTAWELAVAEDHVLGHLGVAGGLARRAVALRAAAPDELGLACGGWKKWPVAMKPTLRAALAVAGLGHRLVDTDFVYVDKNSVRLLGGAAEAAAAGCALDHGPVAVQVGDPEEGVRAARAGCSIVMVDDGSLQTLAATDTALRMAGLRSDVHLAFGGGITEATLRPAHAAGAEIVDIGRAVLDAPLWDLRFEVDL